MDIGTVEDIIAELTEIAKIVAFIWHEPSIPQFPIPHTSRGLTDSCIGMHGFRDGHQAEQKNSSTQEEPPLFYFLHVNINASMVGLCC